MLLLKSSTLYCFYFKCVFFIRAVKYLILCKFVHIKFIHLRLFAWEKLCFFAFGNSFKPIMLIYIFFFNQKLARGADYGLEKGKPTLLLSFVCVCVRMCLLVWYEMRCWWTYTNACMNEFIVICSSLLSQDYLSHFLSYRNANRLRFVHKSEPGPTSPSKGSGLRSTVLCDASSFGVNLA